MPRRVEIVWTPALLAALLLAGLGVQLALPSASPVEEAAAAPPPTARRPKPPALTPPPSPPEDAALLARPLFSPARSQTSTGEGAAAAETLALLGVGSGDGRAAATISAGGQEARSLRPGETIGGWRLVAVGRGSAALTRDGRTLVLQVGAPAASPAAPHAPS